MDKDTQERLDWIMATIEEQTQAVRGSTEYDELLAALASKVKELQRQSAEARPGE